MNNIESRIEKLEKQTGADKPEPVTIVVVYDDTGKPSEAAPEAAKADYKATHPDWQEQDLNIVWVTNENTKRGLERIMAGERT